MIINIAILYALLLLIWPVSTFSSGGFGGNFYNNDGYGGNYSHSGSVDWWGNWVTIGIGCHAKQVETTC